LNRKSALRDGLSKAEKNGSLPFHMLPANRTDLSICFFIEPLQSKGCFLEALHWYAVPNPAT